MFRSILSLGLLASYATVVFGQTVENITIAALPTFSTCQQAVISWSGGKTPYRVYIYPEGFVNQSDWVVELPLTTRAQIIWNVNLAAGSGVVVNIWDGVNDAYSEPTWIHSGDSSCLGYNGTSASSATGSNSTLPTSSSFSSSSRAATVVSTPAARPTQITPSSAPTPQPSAPTSPSQPPAAETTVTVTSPNGASRGVVLDLRWSLIPACVSLGCFTWV